MIKIGDLVKYAWEDGIGVVIEVDRFGATTPRAKVLWSNKFASKCNSSVNSWWTPMDRWLLKVSP